MKFFIKDFFSIFFFLRIFFSFLQIWSHLLKKSLMDNFIFCAVYILDDYYLINQISEILPDDLADVSIFGDHLQISLLI